ARDPRLAISRGPSRCTCSTRISTSTVRVCGSTLLSVCEKPGRSPVEARSLRSFGATACGPAPFSRGALTEPNYSGNLQYFTEIFRGPSARRRMATIRNRIILILILIGASIWALFPRDTTIRQLNQNGVWYDTTQRHVPLKKGLDLQGGMYLALEVDQSKQAVTNISEAIDRALKVVRNRIDQLGVAETDVR